MRSHFTGSSCCHSWPTPCTELWEHRSAGALPFLGLPDKQLGEGQGPGQGPLSTKAEGDPGADLLLGWRWGPRKGWAFSDVEVSCAGRKSAFKVA